uniref:Transposase MuDR plant domain-containing protein n=1 Tax=Fagus sylvatica TaxID=28930 RepID=A0A2N9H0X3_FAGSY
MAPVTVYIRYNGEIIFGGDHGVQYEGMHMKIIRVKQGISFKKLRRKIFSALELDHHSNVITITFRCPQEILSQRVVYMPMLINDDNAVNHMFDVLNETPQLKGVELYIIITPQLIGVGLYNGEDVQHANLDGYGGEELQEDYNVLTQPLTTPYCDIPTPLEERGGSSSRHEHLSPILMDECNLNRYEEHVPSIVIPVNGEGIQDEGVQDDHLDDVFIASQTLHDIDDVRDDYEDSDCELIVNGCDNEMEFRKGLIFSNKADVQYAAKIYSIERNQRYKVYESNLTQWGINCTNGCSWKLRACQRKKHGFWEITKYSGPHTCTNIDVSKDGKMLDSNLIEREILNQVVADHGVKISTLDAQIFKQYEVKVSYYKLWDTKQKAIARIYGDWVQSYEILPKFMLALQEANPTTVVKFLKKDGFERNTERFQRVFWAFGPCIAGFVHCRPVISIDGTHLYGKYQGKLLIAMAQDANNEIYPLAFAIVENESESTWKWFLSLIRLHVTQRKASNFLKRYKDQNLKNMIMRAGSANQERKFNTTMDCIRRYNEEAELVPHPRAFVFRGGFLLGPSSLAKGAGACGTVVGMSEGGGESIWVEPVGVSSIWGVMGGGVGWVGGLLGVIGWVDELGSAMTGVTGGVDCVGGLLGVTGRVDYVGGLLGVTGRVDYVDGLLGVTRRVDELGSVMAGITGGMCGMGGIWVGNWEGGMCGMRGIWVGRLYGMGGNWESGMCGMGGSWVGGLCGMGGNWEGGMCGMGGIWVGNWEGGMCGMRGIWVGRLYGMGGNWESGLCGMGDSWVGRLCGWTVGSNWVVDELGSAMAGVTRLVDCVG